MCKSAARAGTAHAFDVFEHVRPVKPKMHAMEGVVGIEVPANGVGMECNKENIVEFCWHHLEMSVG
jgi:hypothetical protein